MINLENEIYNPINDFTNLLLLFMETDTKNLLKKYLETIKNKNKISYDIYSKEFYLCSIINNENIIEHIPDEFKTQEFYLEAVKKKK